MLLIKGSVSFQIVVKSLASVWTMCIMFGGSLVKQHPFRRHDIQSGCLIVQSIIRPDDENFPSEPSSVSKSFELLQLASVETFQQHVWTTLSVRPAMGFLSKTQI